MGLMDMITSAATNLGGGTANAAATGGLLEAIQHQPGGIGGVMQAFQQNGLGGLVQQWSAGQTAPVAPEQVEQGLGPTGMIDTIAQRTGLSPAVIKTALAVAIPMVIHHFVTSGHVTPEGQQTGAPAPESGNILQSVLSRIL